jgi:hypothetical protein
MMCRILQFTPPPLHVGLAHVLFDHCVDTEAIARQLASSIAECAEPADALLMAAFEAAHARKLDMHVLFHEIEDFAFARA